MSLSLTELSVYAFALFLLFLTPGPVWVALTARCLQSGFSGGWPLALGVAGGRHPAPSSLAMVTLTNGVPSYSFYRDGTAERHGRGGRYLYGNDAGLAGPERGYRPADRSVTG